MYLPDSLIEVYGTRIGAYGVFVYSGLACKADTQGEATLTIDALATMLGISARQVFRALERLQAHHLVTITRVRNWNVYTLNLPNSHGALPNSHGALPNSHGALPNSHGALPSPFTGNGSEIPSLVPPVPDLSPVPDPKSLLDPKEKPTPLPPSGGPHARTRKHKPSARRVFTRMSEDPETQEALKQSILTRPTWQPWLIQSNLTHMDIDTQWEGFVRKALAKGYSYLSWYSAFQNWLTSPFQHTQNGSAHGMSHTLEETNRMIDEEEQWRATL
jgi:hypothetical protein